MRTLVSVLIGVFCVVTGSSWAATELAKVNQQTITDQDLELALVSIPAGQKKNILKDPSTRQQILDDLISRTLLVQEGMKDKLDQGAEYKQALQNFRASYLVNGVIHIEIEPRLGDPAPAKFYKKNLEWYRTDSVHILHILTQTEAEARSVLEQVKVPGADFQAIAEKISKDPAAKTNRGDVGLVDRKQFAKEFSDVVFSAAAGTLIDRPLRTDAGYHIVKVVEKKKGVQLEYGDVEMRVKEDLKFSLMQDYLGQLRKKSKKVNPHEISDQELEAALVGMPEGQRRSMLKNPASRSQLVEDYINRALLVQEGARKKMDVTSDYKQAAQNFRASYLANKVIQKAIEPRLNESEYAKYFKMNRGRYNTDTVHIQHILSRTEPEALEILKKVKTPGTDFQVIAEKLSKDPSAKNNRGDIGFIGRNQFVREFSDPVFQASKGSIIGPLKTDFGYHIVKIMDRKVGSRLEYSEVEMRVQEELKASLMQDYLATLRKKSKITLNTKALQE